ncbi:MAG: hypothetical protein MJK14_11405 [Rivularia sp. ALOHA_DT_140]|nr:hypothetical protein [Rivularia sp. ALOHA_DT_140]
MKRNILLVLAVPTVIIGTYFFGRNLQNQNNASQVISESKQLKTAKNQAIFAVELGKSAKTKNQWGTVVQLWEKAITQMKNVPTDSAAYELAQKKIVEYQGYLKIARDKHKSASSSMILIKTIHGNIRACFQTITTIKLMRSSTLRYNFVQAFRIASRYGETV